MIAKNEHINFMKHVNVDVNSVSLKDCWLMSEKVSAIWNIAKIKKMLPDDVQSRLKPGVVYTATLSAESKDGFHNLIIAPKKDKNFINRPVAERPQPVTVSVKSSWVADEWEHAINNNGSGTLWEHSVLLV